MGMNFFLIDKNAHVHVHMGFFKLPFFSPFSLGSNVALFLFCFFFPPSYGQRRCPCFSFDFLGSGHDIYIYIYILTRRDFSLGYDFYFFFNKFG